ncbi:MAG TPA: hypothetical protein VFA11_00325 [Acidimicrobiales bacterium]|nr:hypothetical protein [Acidimicrobiales bacterium]
MTPEDLGQSDAAHMDCDTEPLSQGQLRPNPDLALGRCGKSLGVE